MTDLPPRLFDRDLLSERRRRARRRPRSGADFLLARVVEDLDDRLAAILHRFAVAVDLGPFAGPAAQCLIASGKIDQVLRAGPPDVADLDFVADEAALPFAPESLDLVVSLLSLQFVDDLPGTLVQIRRALRPDGLLLASLMGGQTLFELRDSLLSAEIETTGGASPRVAPFLDVRDLGGLLQRAGFALPVTDTDRVVVRYDDMFDLVADLRAMGAANPLVERSRRPTPRALFLRAAEIYAERHADADGRLRATFEIVSASGWTPHESQQKPLRPGSARMRLADALSTREITLPSDDAE